MKLRREEGFTLIELLIVIAILGTLAVVVLLALNPVQQLARTRDAGRISGITQVGHAVEAWATSNNGTYPVAGATWLQTLVDAGEISQLPSSITYSAPTTGGRSGPSACATNAVNATWCYNAYGGASPTRAIIFSKLESAANNNRCAGTTVAWAVYSTANGRGGVLCTTNQTTPPADPTAAGYGTGTGVNQFLP